MRYEAVLAVTFCETGGVVTIVWNQVSFARARGIAGRLGR